MEYIRGKFRQMIFESDNGYKVGLFKVKETSKEMGISQVQVYRKEAKIFEKLKTRL